MAQKVIELQEELVDDPLPSISLDLEAGAKQQDMPSSPIILTPTEDEPTFSSDGAVFDIDKNPPVLQRPSTGNGVQGQKQDASKRAQVAVNISVENAGRDTDAQHNGPIADQVEPSVSNDSGPEASTQAQPGPSDSIPSCSPEWDEEFWTREYGDLEDLVHVFDDRHDSSDSNDDSGNNENGNDGDNCSNNGENENNNEDGNVADCNDADSYCSTCCPNEEEKDNTADEDEEWTNRDFGDDPEEHDGSSLDNSPARLEWLRQKREENEENEYLDRLMSMIGHENVKHHFLAIKERVGIAKRWNEDIKTLKLDLVLHGRDGTGKKRIAQLYAEFLYSIGAISRRRFTKTSRYRYPSNSSSNVVFFERADRITASSEIESILENVRQAEENVVLILSYRELGGSSRDALKGTVEARNRFPNPIVLEDYNESELTQLVQGFAKKHGGFDDGMDTGVSGIWARRLIRRRENSGSSFSLIDSARDEAEKILLNQENRFEREWVDWARTHSPDADDADAQRPPLHDRHVTHEDILGPNPEDMRNTCEAWNTIQQMVGIESAKKEIEHLFNLARFNYQLEAQGKKPMQFALNRCFLGPPGVGKTTVAQLYAEILAHLGLVSKGRVVLKNPSSFMGQHRGDVETLTRDALKKAKGGVLIIDDAHMLHYSKDGIDDSGRDRTAIIDTIVANISGNTVEDRCVLMVGYPDRMGDMFLNSNPGLQRRFPLENSIRFDSYNDEQLCQILSQKMAQDNLSASESAMKAARQVLSRMRTRPGFGNGGDVESLLSQARLRRRERLDGDGVDRLLMDHAPFEPQDFDPDHDRASRADDDRNDLFGGFIGYDEIIAEFSGYQKMADGMRRYDIDPTPYIPWAFIFKGPPGTGKTSTARSIGKLFCNMGLISSSDVVVCSATDLIGQYKGQTGPKVINQFELGLGKVLFVDEAYRLASHHHHGDSFREEAVGEIVDCMTNPRYAGNMVVILAGYDSDMERLLQSNQGLRSRFPKHISFPHLTPEHCIQLLKQELAKLNIGVSAELDEPTDPTRQTVSEVFLNLSRTKGWANGRDVVTLAKTTIGRVFMKVSGFKPDRELGKLMVCPEELVLTLLDMLKERGGKGFAARLRV